MVAASQYLQRIGVAPAERAPDLTALRELQVAHLMTDFTPRSEFLQNEPGLAWTEKPFATRATAPDGSRITLRSGVLRVRDGRGEFVDTSVTDEEFDALLSEHFGL